MVLKDEEKKYLLKLARSTLERCFNGEKDLVPKKVPFESLKREAGTFVTLTESGELRGCIGHIIPANPIYIDIVQNTLSAAFEDPRFDALKKSDLATIRIEISVLTVPKKLDYRGSDDLMAKLRPRKDGVVLTCGGRGATFLPQVWDELPKKEDFLGHLCMKAWLSKDAWKENKCKIETYQVEAFEE